MTKILRNDKANHSIGRYSLLTMVILSFVFSSFSLFSQAQNLYYTGFENSGSWPSGWTQEYVEYDWDGYYIDWSIRSGGSNPSGAYSGSYFAIMRNYWYGGVTRLVMPVINFGEYKKNPKLKFQHYMRNWAGDQDRLKVLYKTSASGSWTELASYSSDVSSWTSREITLENVGSTYYIAFEGSTDYGYGVCIDEVFVQGEPLLPDAGITALISPASPFSVGVQNVTVTLKSFDEVKLTSCWINWSINGVNQSSYYWTGNLGKDETANVTLGTYNFNYPPQGPFNPFNVAIWTSSPNGGADGNSANDYLSRSVSPILNDAGVVGIYGPPEGFAPGNADVRVRVKNYAPKPLSSIRINWSVEGIAQQSKNFSGLNVANGETVDLIVGQYNFGQPRLYSITATSADPNGIADEVQSNDSYTGGMGPSLGPGTYTVGGPGANFATLKDFVLYLNGSGIIGNGTVTCEVRSGTQTNQYELGEYPGNSNDVIITSMSGNPNDVIIDYTPTLANNYVFMFDNAKNIHFRNVTFRNNAGASANAGRIMNMMNSQNLHFHNVTFLGVQNPQSVDYNQIAYGHNTNSYMFDNCRFNYGSRGIHDHNLGACSRDIHIMNSQFNGQTNAGVYIHSDNLCSQRSNSVMIHDNSFGSAAGISPMYGVYSMDGASYIENNSFSSMMNGAGVYIENTEMNTQKVYVNDNRFNGLSYADGINIMNAYGAEVNNNQINITGSYSQAGIKMFNVGRCGSGVVELIDDGTLPEMPLIKGNTVNATNAFGLYAQYGCAWIIYNYFNSSSDYSGYGLAALWAEGMEGVAAVNQLVGQNSNGASILWSMGFELYYNSVNCTGMYDAALSFDYYGGDDGDYPDEYDSKTQKKQDEINSNYGTTMMRNLFVNTGGGYAVMGYPGFIVSDENNFHTNGQYFGDYFTTFNDWKNSTGQDGGSANIPISYKTPTDLHLTQFDTRIYETYPLFNHGGVIYPEIEKYDWDMEIRDDVYYYGVDNIVPVVTIILQPEPVIVCINGTTGDAVFNVTANVSLGGEPIYQWQKDGIDIPGATQASYVIPAANINFDHSGVYSCMVRGTGGAKAVESEEVLLYVLTDPEITRQPETVVADEGGTAHFEVQAHIQLTGFPIAKLRYQWYKGDLNNPLSDNDKVAGSDASILTIRHIEVTDYANDYFVVITGLCGSVTSSFVGILPQPDVAITSQPISASNCEGTSSVFTVMAEIVGGGQSLSYQWYKNGMELIDDAKISGSDTPVLMISNLETADEGIYTVMVTVFPGGKYKVTNDANLTVKLKPTITNDLPATLAAENGRSFSLTIEAAGFAPLTYQWYKDGNELAGETMETFTVPAADAVDEGIYKVKVMNECGEIWSAETEVTVTNGNQTSVSEISGNGYTLYSNNPNPASNETVVAFVVPEATAAKLTLTDAFGREIAVLFENVAQSGRNEVRLNADRLNLSSGVYYYTLSARGFNATMKMIIVR